MKMLPVSFRGILIRLGVCQGAPPSVANFYSALLRRFKTDGHINFKLGGNCHREVRNTWHTF